MKSTNYWYPWIESLVSRTPSCKQSLQNYRKNTVKGQKQYNKHQLFKDIRPVQSSAWLKAMQKIKKKEKKTRNEKYTTYVHCQETKAKHDRHYCMRFLQPWYSQVIEDTECHGSNDGWWLKTTWAQSVGEDDDEKEEEEEEEEEEVEEEGEEESPSAIMFFKANRKYINKTPSNFRQPWYSPINNRMTSNIDQDKMLGELRVIAADAERKDVDVDHGSD